MLLWPNHRIPRIYISCFSTKIQSDFCLNRITKKRTGNPHQVPISGFSLKVRALATLTVLFLQTNRFFCPLESMPAIRSNQVQ